jgi:CBS domain-containing protein
MKVRDALRRHAVTVDAATTLAVAAQRMDRAAVGTLLVTDGGRLVGLVTDRDVVVRGVARRLAHDARIDAVMSTALHTIEADADLQEAVDMFSEHPIRRLPVLDGGEALGVLTVDDVVIDLADDLDRVLRPVTAQVLFASPEAPMPAPLDW